MSGFEAFLKQNKKEAEHRKIAASKSFVDENGEPLLWEIRPLKSKEAASIRKETNKLGKKGNVIIDNELFNRKVAAAATVYPNLNDAVLQESYGVIGAENLIMEMLDNDGEYQAYIKEIMEISGYDVSDEELVETAKN